MNKPTKPNIVIPESFAENGIKTDFDNEKLTNGFDRLQPDVLAGDNLNKFIDDTYKGLNYGMAAADAINLIQEGETLTVQNGQLVSGSTGSTGSGLEICDIGMALYIDETKGLRRYLNGQIVAINKNTQGFLTRLKKIVTLYPSLLTTEENWQAAKTLSAFGQVGKFVFNYAEDGETVESVRLPAVVNVQGLIDLQNLGVTVAAGLPNITDTSNGYCTAQTSNGSDVSGCIYNIPLSVIQGATNNAGWSAKFGIDASLSNSIYGNSTTQPEAIQYPYFIQIATGSETEANIVNTLKIVNGFTLLESKYSDKPLYNESWLLSNGQENAKAVYPTVYEGLQVEYNTEIEVGTTVTLPSGLSYTKRGLSVKLSTEDYTDYDFVLNTADETFRLPLKNGTEGMFAGQAVVGNGITLGLTDGVNNASLLRFDNSGAVTTDPVKSGLVTSNSVPDGFALYYYVGETVQNANLIDAGRLQEQIININAPSRSYLVQSYVNGTSGYRVYSDGWCEQWGRITIGADSAIGVIFLKPFMNAPYYANWISCSGESLNGEGTRACTNLTTTSMRIYNGQDCVMFANWYICGY